MSGGGIRACQIDQFSQWLTLGPVIVRTSSSMGEIYDICVYHAMSHATG